MRSSLLPVLRPVRNITAATGNVGAFHKSGEGEKSPPGCAAITTPPKSNLRANISNEGYESRSLMLSGIIVSRLCSFGY